MTTEVTIKVPETANYNVEVVEQVIPRGPNDDGRRTLILVPGDNFTTYIYHLGRSIVSIREIPH